MRGNIVRYAIAVSIGLIIAFIIALSRRVFSEADPAAVMGILSDAFFVSGVLLTCVGLILVVTSGGVFDMLAYSMIMLVSLFRRNTERKYKDFYEYRTSKKDRKFSVAYLLIVGIAFVVIAFVFLLLYNKFNA